MQPFYHATHAYATSTNSTSQCSIKTIECTIMQLTLYDRLMILSFVTPKILLKIRQDHPQSAQLNSTEN